MAQALLAKDWILVPAIDRELKRYTLLAYLQEVGRRFTERKLYPYLLDVAGHLDGLERLQQCTDQLRSTMPRDITGLDPRTGTVTYAALPQPEGALGVIDEVIDDALPELRERLAQGNELRERICDHIQFGPVGVLPLDPRAGYLLLRQGREARIYSYAVTLLRDAEERLHWRSVVTQYVGSRAVGLHRTYEAIRAELIATRPQLPVPATFGFECAWEVPHIETFMPLAKQLVHRYLMAERPAERISV
ncbi:MAG: hypothetical protein IT228_09240 [Flavobacteriales bacterium]|nr:hypothetical protein [Flavobacteriales bacterium]MCC6577511.1 hypothetical protein [Flavobacteriales bacterium]NUQ14200.1 hypothetical protein [Flavobacteriales bacterium]